MRVPSEALDAAARIYINGDMSCDFDGEGQYEGFTDEQREYAQSLVRNMIEAAAPFILAEGYRMVARGLETDTPKNAPWVGEPTPEPEVLRMAAKVLDGGA